MEALHTKKRKMSEKNKKQICLFGLSADPVTGEQGHVGIVKELLRIDEYFDEIWILPVYIHTYVVRSTKESRNHNDGKFPTQPPHWKIAFSNVNSGLDLRFGQIPVKASALGIL
jgi:hypothetical protein